MGGGHGGLTLTEDNSPTEGSFILTGQDQRGPPGPWTLS